MEDLTRILKYSLFTSNILFGARLINVVQSQVIKEKKALFARSGSYVSNDLLDLEPETEKEEIKQKSEKVQLGPFMKDDLDDDVVLGNLNANLIIIPTSNGYNLN